MTDIEVDHVHVEKDHEHPPDSEYIIVAAVLAAMTGAEVSLYYVNFDFTINVILLCILMVMKFSLVVMFFMHLRFDNRLFRYFFITGLSFAVVCYLIVLTTFHFWWGG